MKNAYAKMTTKMKLRSTTPLKNLSRKRVAFFSVAVIGLIGIGSFLAFNPSNKASADEYDEKIAAIQAQIDQYNAKAEELSKQADTLQRQLNLLATQKSTIQAQINSSQAKYEKLKAQIAENEKKIEERRTVLGNTLADLYVDDQTSPLEMLASSNNIADYVDEQAQQESVRDALVQSIEEINRLKAELEKQQKEVKQVLADQEDQKEALVAKENERAKLLSETQGKESAYNKLSAAGASEQDKLRQQQQEAIAAAMAAASRSSGGGSNGTISAGSPDKGGYPSRLANARQDSIVDDWGMLNRECVSYVAWKVYQKNGYMPYWGGRGNAKQWPGNAKRAKIPTGSEARARSAGVIYAGKWGHIVWVDSVNSNGTINISQYNYNWGAGRGLYSTMSGVLPSSYDIYIYF